MTLDLEDFGISTTIHENQSSLQKCKFRSKTKEPHWHTDTHAPYHIPWYYWGALLHWLSHGFYLCVFLWFYYCLVCLTNLIAEAQ